VSLPQCTYSPPRSLTRLRHSGSSGRMTTSVPARGRRTVLSGQRSAPRGIRTPNVLIRREHDHVSHGLYQHLYHHDQLHRPCQTPGVDPFRATNHATRISSGRTTGAQRSIGLRRHPVGPAPDNRRSHREGRRDVRSSRSDAGPDQRQPPRRAHPHRPAITKAPCTTRETPRTVAPSSTEARRAQPPGARTSANTGHEARPVSSRAATPESRGNMHSPSTADEGRGLARGG
jgi:hypothetical protein